MKNNDLFSDLSLGGMGKYGDRNAEALREERAAELDRRIKEFYGREHTLEWANSVPDFCDRETIQNKDVFDLSTEAHRLPKIRQEADALIQKEEERVAAEKAAAKAAEEAAKKAAQDAVVRAAKHVDDLITSLADAPRSRYWCEEVEMADQEVKNLARESRLLCRKLQVLDELMVISRTVREAADLDERIRLLKREKAHDNDWGKAVRSLKDQMDAECAKYMKDLDLYNELILEVQYIERQPIFMPYRECLEQLESGGASQSTVRKTFEDLDRKLGGVGFSLDTYINNFSDRWNAAKTMVANEEQRIINEQREAEALARKAEEARKAREKEEERQRIADEYASCLSDIELGRADEEWVRSRFFGLDSRSKMPNFSLNNYIDNFTARWNAAKKTVKEEEQRARELAAKQLAEQKRLEREEAERQRLEALARARREKNKKRVKVIVAICVALAVLAGIVTAGLLLGEWRHWFFGAAVSVAFLLLVRLLPAILKKGIPAKIIRPVYIALDILIIVLLCLGDDTRIYAVCLSVMMLLAGPLPCWIAGLFKSSTEWLKTTRLVFENYPAVAVQTILSLLEGTVLSVISFGLINTGMVRWLIFGLGFAAVLLIFVLSVCALYPFNSPDRQATETTWNSYMPWNRHTRNITVTDKKPMRKVFLLVMDIIVAVLSVVLLFFSHETAMISLCLTAAAVLYTVILWFSANIFKNYLRHVDRLSVVAALLCVAALIPSFCVFMWGHPESDFKIEDGVLTKCYIDEGVVVIPEGVTVIDEGVFDGDDKITEVILPASLIEIRQNAFLECSGLKKVQFSEGLKTIGEAAFSWCTALDEINLPSTLETIEPWAFNHCALSEVVIPDSVKTVDNYAFANCEELTKVVFGSGIEYLGQQLFDHDKKLETVAYNGTEEAWNEIEKYTEWFLGEGDCYWDTDAGDYQMIFLGEQIGQ